MQKDVTDKRLIDEKFKQYNKSYEKPKKRRKRKPINILWDRCWKLMSDYIRERDNFICFTCGKKGDKYNIHAGHFMHSSQDFDERNIHAQCIRCNHMLSGNLAEYAIRLIDLYGIEVVKELRAKKHIAHKYTIKELNEIFLWLNQTKLNADDKRTQSKDNW